jgi:hypothetical protein
MTRFYFEKTGGKDLGEVFEEKRKKSVLDWN